MCVINTFQCNAFEYTPIQCALLPFFCYHIKYTLSLLTFLSNKRSNLALLKLCFYFPTLFPMCSSSGAHNPIYCPLVIKAKCLEIIFYSSVLLIPTLKGWLILSSLLPKSLLSLLTASSLSAVILVLHGYYITS